MKYIFAMLRSGEPSGNVLTIALGLAIAAGWYAWHALGHAPAPTRTAPVPMSGYRCPVPNVKRFDALAASRYARYTVRVEQYQVRPEKPPQCLSSGSGVIASNSAHVATVVTDRHVVFLAASHADGVQLVVRTIDNAPHLATIRTSSTFSDLAVLEMPCAANICRPAVIANGVLRSGDRPVIVGYTFGAPVSYMHPAIVQEHPWATPSGLIMTWLLSRGSESGDSGGGVWLDGRLMGVVRAGTDLGDPNATHRIAISDAAQIAAIMHAPRSR